MQTNIPLDKIKTDTLLMLIIQLSEITSICYILSLQFYHSISVTNKFIMCIMFVNA